MTDLDRNKSTLTHRITGTAWGYLHGAGFKPIETEVSVAPGWIADLASFIYPTQTELKNMKLNKRFIAEHGDNWYAYMHYKYAWPLTAIVEVKASTSDFKKDIDRKFKGPKPAHLLYLAYPTGIIEDNELPEGWIGLKCSKEGDKLIKVITKDSADYWMMKYAHMHPMNPGDIADFIAQVAIRRHHRTEYAESRAFMKQWRAKKAGYAKGNPFKAISLVAEFLRRDGHDLEQDLETILIKYGYNVPNYLMEDLKFLEGLKKS